MLGVDDKGSDGPNSRRLSSGVKRSVCWMSEVVCCCCGGEAKKSSGLKAFCVFGEGLGDSEMNGC